MRQTYSRSGSAITSAGEILRLWGTWSTLSDDRTAVSSKLNHMLKASDCKALWVYKL